ncbi:predicted protein [Naegleria gruberi]|uniref:Predicted protein n=1 Tax=Naegleria gruberi TaxID=5762 RepID=D2V5W5_NAEGR|nr:uncharacterized protein NAEGRDRAFT_64225 [Naegleria gruberi]EFC47868.1 predicted protein [Naegleria gruberi]|eukprot:XP_002680612.1 predicted protein [Naegleria gruberi strain NEG-M]
MSSYSSLANEIIHLDDQYLSSDLSQQLIDYAQTIDEESLVFDFSENSYAFPKKLVLIMTQVLKEFNSDAVSSIAQYFVIALGTISDSYKLTGLNLNNNDVVELVKITMSGLNDDEKSDEIRYLLLSLLVCLFTVKFGGFHPDQYRRNLKTLQSQINDNVLSAIFPHVSTLMTIVDNEAVSAPVVNLIVGISNLLSVEKREQFIELITEDYDSSKNFTDKFLRHINCLEVDIHNSYMFILSAIDLQNKRSDINLFLTNDVNFLVDILLREEEKWAGSLYAQDEKDLKTPNVLGMYETRMENMKALTAITKSKIYLEEKVTTDVHRKDDIANLMRKVLNEREPSNAPPIFFSLKEQALEVLDNTEFIK